MRVEPTSFSHRSPLYRSHAARGAVFAVVNDAAVVETYGGVREADIARSMGLSDLSPLPRIGFKGRGALDWLRTRNVAVGDEDNRAYPLEGGNLVARLAPTEALVLGDRMAESRLCAGLDEAWDMDGAVGTYLVPRQGANYWFRVTGERAASMFAKVCGVDLRLHKFRPLAVAQTSVARSNAIVIRDDLGETPAYHLLGDSASAEYMWSCLLDAMDEFGGRPVGHAALHELAAG